jgi:hypothetical protein
VADRVAQFPNNLQVNYSIPPKRPFEVRPLLQILTHATICNRRNQATSFVDLLTFSTLSTDRKSATEKRRFRPMVETWTHEKQTVRQQSRRGRNAFLPQDSRH